MNDRSPEIDVLLATYNGQDYIEEFMQSLISQVGVSIHLYVSDDGSDDRTLEKIKAYKNYLRDLTIVSGPRNGPSSNFFRLLEFPSSTYVALADQDDIWKSDKLIRGINTLKSRGNPALYVSAVNLLHSKKINSAHDFNYPLDFFFSKNQGCTFIFNKKLLTLLQHCYTDRLFYHDWFIYLVSKNFGEVIIDEWPSIFYRIHQGNFVGRRSFAKKIFAFFDRREARDRISKILIQIDALKLLATSEGNIQLCVMFSEVKKVISDREFIQLFKLTGAKTVLKHPLRMVYMCLLMLNH